MKEGMKDDGIKKDTNGRVYGDEREVRKDEERRKRGKEYKEMGLVEEEE